MDGKDKRSYGILPMLMCYAESNKYQIQTHRVGDTDHALTSNDLRFLYHYPIAKKQNYQYTTHTKIITYILHILHILLKSFFPITTLD